MIAMLISRRDKRVSVVGRIGQISVYHRNIIQIVDYKQTFSLDRSTNVTPSMRSQKA
jgi:ATP-dependent helicase/DNAse subunit B